MGRRIRYEMATLGGPARSAAASLLSATAEETIGSVMANALIRIEMAGKSRLCRRCSSRSDFSPLDLNNGKTAVYWVQPPELLGVHQRLLRLMSTSCLNAVLKGRKERGKGSDAAVIFDECYALGKLDLLLKAAALARGFGARGIFFFQNKGQARELYGKNAGHFLRQFRAGAGLSVNDRRARASCSDRMGDRWRWRKRKARDIAAASRSTMSSHTPQAFCATGRR